MTGPPASEWQGVYLRRGSASAGVPYWWVPLRGIYKGLACSVCGRVDRQMYRLEPTGADLCVEHRDPAEEQQGEENPHGR